MKNVKSLVKRLIGKSDGNRLPITIDICAKTVDGYCIIGWYLTDEVTSIAIYDNNSNLIDTAITDIERADVVAHVKKPAIGFQLLCETQLSLESLRLAVTLKSGNEDRIPLVLKNNDVAGVVPVDTETHKPIVSSTSGVKATCEFAFRCEDHIYLCGWLVDKESVISGFLCDKKKKQVANIEQQFRFPRQDVREALGKHIKPSTGFLVLLKRTDELQDLKGKFSFAINVAGVEASLPILEVFDSSDDAILNLRRFLGVWQPHNPAHLGKSEMFTPMLQSLFPKHKKTRVNRIDFGQPADNPRASIIIPLYGRFDFLRYQLSHFNRYKGYRDTEILYVVDDPNILNATRALAKRMAQMVEQPFSLITLADNMGFGTANNIGVEHAKAEYVVLMNSDVMPQNGEWLDKMIAVASSDDAGIVGARLLFEDDTIQHDGMAPMRIAEYQGLLFNDHPRKGWPKSLAKVSSPFESCDLLTAACWVIKKSLFEEVEGFDSAYVLGDFEDSDLCFKMLAIGKTNYIRRDIALYHLERQSQNLVASGGWKHNLTILNAVTFNQRWKDELVALDKELQVNG